MSCPEIIKLTLPDAYEGCTWDGLTWTIDSVDDGNTEYAAILSLAEFEFKDSTGVFALALSSTVSGEVTINTASSNAWSVTVEPRAMTLSAGVYSFALVTTDADSVKSPQIIGSIRIHAQPIT